MKIEEKKIIAELTFYNLPSLSKKDYGRLLVWLEGKFEEMQRADLNDYNKKFTAKLFK